MVKKYDTMASNLKKIDSKCGNIIEYTTKGQLPMFHGESESLRQWIKNNDDHRLSFYKRHYKNACYMRNSPYGGIGSGSVKLQTPSVESFLNHDFVESYPSNPCVADVRKVLDNVDDVVTKRYFKNPEQCWISLMSNAGIERMAYWTTLIKNGKAANVDQLKKGLDEALTCLLYASVKHPLAFHGKWTKVSRHRAESNEIKKFNDLLENSDFQNALASFVSQTGFKVNQSALRAYTHANKSNKIIDILNGKVSGNLTLDEASTKLVEYLDSHLY